MNLLSTQSLTHNQTKDILSLLECCRRYEPVTLSFPLEEDAYFFLLYEHNMLRSALTLYCSEDKLWECIACTDPAMRKKGYFSQLLNEALCVVSEDEMYFLTDEHSPDAKNTLKALSCDYWYSEYRMCLEPGQFPITVTKHPNPTTIYLESNKELETDSFYYIAYAKLHNQNKQIGSCRIFSKETSFFLYQFEIEETMRRQGYGTLFLAALLSDSMLSEKELSLQVSSLNTPALCLYEKTGFRIVETLSYYLY